MEKTISWLLCVLLLSLVGCEPKDNSDASDNAKPNTTARGIKVEAKTAGDEQRIALVIGNAAYRNSPLANPANDAEDMARVLAELGFEVSREIDATREQMGKAIHTFSARLKEGGVGLFYYAGHGMQVNGANYLIPVDAAIEAEYQIPYRAIDAGLVLSAMEAAGNSLNIVIMDACRDNPFARSFRSESRGLARMDAPAGSLIVYATAPGKAAADGDGRNGVFTASLLRHIETPGVSVTRLMQLVRAEVVAATEKAQIPWSSSSLLRDFYFREKTTAPDPQLDSSKWGWQKYHNKMATAYQQYQGYDRDRELTAEDKAKAWEEFSSAFAAENPYSKEDEAMRAHAAARVEHWRSEQQQIAAQKKKGGRYRVSEEGVIYDTKTGLEWYVGPDRGINHYDAEKYAKNLTVAGGGWRLPSIKELRGIYEKGAGSRNMDPVFKTTAWLVWIGELTGSSSARYFFFDGGLDYSRYRFNSNASRVFGVRAGRR